MNDKEQKTVKTIGDGSKKMQWAPAKLLDTIAGLETDKYTYRWLNSDLANLTKKQAEGWEIVNTLEGDKAKHARPGVISDGSNLSPSITSYRELVLARMPNEVADARNEYYANKTNENVDELKEELSRKAGAIGGQIHGKISVGTRIIE